MSSEVTLGEELQTLRERWEQLTAVPEAPRTTLGTIEYSLGSQRKAEVYVNRLLTYLLDPEEPHGLGTDFLRGFLEELPPVCEFQEDTYDLSDVVVNEQVRITETEDGTAVSSGFVDLVIEVPNEWFLMVELKFSAEDTQTEFYYRDATHVDGVPKADYKSETYYLYLHQYDQPTANEPNFDNWTWRAFSEDVLEPFIVEHGARYPQRTVTQLRALNDDLANITGMTDQQQNDQEKIALYLDHYDTISDVTDTFDEAWERFTDEWAPRLGTKLEDAGKGTAANPVEDLTKFELSRPEDSSEQWLFRSSSSDWGMLFKDGWWRHTNALNDSIWERPDDRSDVRIGFHHRLGRNRDDAIGDRTLKVYFRNMGANDQDFLDTFSEKFDARTEDIEELLPGDATVTGNKKDKLVVPYDIEVENHEDYFTAYVAALTEAYDDLIASNDDLITEIDDIFNDSLAEAYEYNP